MIFYRHAAGCKCTHCEPRFSLIVQVQGYSDLLLNNVMGHFTVEYVISSLVRPKLREADQPLVLMLEYNSSLVVPSGYITVWPALRSSNSLPFSKESMTPAFGFPAINSLCGCALIQNC